MKAKFINEKFTADSDPIQDMGIGPAGLIKNWIEKIKNKDIELMHRHDIKKAYSSNDNVLYFREYIGRPIPHDIIRKPIGTGSILSYTQLKFDIMIVFGLFSNLFVDKNNIKLDHRKYIDEILQELNLSEFVEFTDYSNEYRIRYKIKPEYVKYFQKYETIFEKFVEDSDPVTDLGITGLRPGRDFDSEKVLLDTLFVYVDKVFSGTNLKWDTDEDIKESLTRVVDWIEYIRIFKFKYKWTIGGKKWEYWYRATQNYVKNRFGIMLKI